MLVFEEGGKPEFPEKNLSEQSREPTNSAHLRRWVRESNPGHIGGRRALSPLRQPCSPKILESCFLIVLFYLFLIMAISFGEIAEISSLMSELPVLQNKAARLILDYDVERNIMLFLCIN